MNRETNSDDLNQTPVDDELDQLKQQQEQDLEEKSIVDIDEFVKGLQTTSRRNERILAFLFIYAMDRFDYSVPLEDIVEQFRVGFELDIPQNSFAIQLSQGTIESRHELDQQIKPNLKNWKLERLGCCTRLILRLSLWELLQKESMPSIIINEAIELAKTFAEKDSYKFINGILDEICKNLEPDSGQDSI